MLVAFWVGFPAREKEKRTKTKIKFVMDDVSMLVASQPGKFSLLQVTAKHINRNKKSI